jgi:hypothetical protein
MSVLKTKKSEPYYWFSFQIKGEKFYGSTRCTDEAEALKFEAARRADAEATKEKKYHYVYQKVRIKPACERCGAREQTHRHHWAPREYFADANSWPTSYLCNACHRLWHETMNKRIRIKTPRRETA